MLRLDHLVFAARTLGEGRAWMAEQLGVPAQGGGAHPGMGTHNALWRLGDVYLEMLAIDPSAPPPARARMFGLDLPGVRARLASGPALVAWVVATDDLDSALAAGAAEFGAALPLSRGDLHWRLTVTEDGRPPLGGALPALIEWPEGVHPAARMPDAGLRLREFRCRTPDAPAARAALAALGGTGLIGYDAGPGPARLSCEIAGPAGLVAFG